MNKFLVIVDMQNDFIDGALGTPEAQAIVPNVVEKIKETGLDTLMIFTKDTHYENYLSTQEGQKLPVGHCIYRPGMTNEGWELNKEIETIWRNKVDKLVINGAATGLFEKDNNTICKSTFGSINLPRGIQSFFEENNDTDEIEIELVGLCTDICVISNAMILKAFFPEAKISVDATCCAGVTPESHENALKAMEMCQIEIKR